MPKGIYKRKYDFITKELLEEQYPKKSIEKIAKKVGCSYTAIRDRLIRYNIKIRTLKEACEGLVKNRGWRGKSFKEINPPRHLKYKKW